MKMMIISQYRQNWGEQGATASRPRPAHLFPSSAVPSCVKLPQRRWSRLVRSGIAHFDYKWQKRSRNPKLRSSDFWWPLPWLSCYLLGLLGLFGPTPNITQPMTHPVWDAGLHQSCHLQPLHFLAILMVNWRAKMMIIYDVPRKKKKQSERDKPIWTPSSAGVFWRKHLLSDLILGRFAPVQLIGSPSQWNGWVFWIVRLLKSTSIIQGAPRLSAGLLLLLELSLLELCLTSGWVRWIWKWGISIHKNHSIYNDNISKRALMEHIIYIYIYTYVYIIWFYNQNPPQRNATL